ncbi:glycosyltransferase [Bacteroides intestinalis]|uniref:Glycosyltransferase n=1 Tax=Bacteroides intestinalis TaxID=329854 RepID=A0A412Y0C0_9BACE|nr:glycosyltransferase [Bacteroides intestinalis]RGV50992.1 glycosyltransferase [Bacteroides intestinalis]RHA57091.1 glycosyltransferase [Bacteroides intestinalis]
MNLLYIITGLGIGGAEIVTINIANEMCKRGHKVSLLFLTGNNRLSYLIDKNIIILGGGMKKNLYSLIKMLFLAKRYVSVFHPQVVHSHMFHANIFSRILHAFNHSFALITTEHNKNIGSNVRMFFYRLTDWLSDINTNVSNEATTYFINQNVFSPKKTFTVYNGLALEKFGRNELLGECIRKQYGISSNEFLFLNVGRLTEAKDQINLIEAFSMLYIKYNWVKLLILGEGELRRKLEILIHKYKLNNNVFLAGAHSNVIDYYSAANCFILSSAWEGLPMTIIEAKAASLPIISTMVAQEIVDPAYVVPIRNSIELMRKMEVVVLMSPKQLKYIGEKNKHESTIFDIEAICDKWEYYYNQLAYI